mmetsp:Transcript_22157/g.61662  ORF Transcript_22157/g.61662 Transcript_22157/m.61662 type:complete len:265 (+) Transcript_22157:1923-2717(+)
MNDAQTWPGRLFAACSPRALEPPSLSSSFLSSSSPYSSCSSSADALTQHATSYRLAAWRCMSNQQYAGKQRMMVRYRKTTAMRATRAVRYTAGTSEILRMANMAALTMLVMLTGTRTSFMAAKKLASVYPPCFLSAMRTMYMSSTPRPSMMNGSVHPMVMLTLMPHMRPNPTEAKNARMTRATPTVVIRIRDSTRSQSRRKRAENRARSTMEMATRVPLSSVMSLSNRPVVPMTPWSSWNPTNFTSPAELSSQSSVQLSSNAFL